ncbi:MAG: hypothetical protein RL217_2115, partial [Pseudomonadota bacterium]
LSATTPSLSLAGRLGYFFDAKNVLPFEQVQQRDFVPLASENSLGYNMGAHWFHLQINPQEHAPTRWVLAIGSPELSEVELWVEQPQGGFVHYPLGYQRPYQNRPVQTRLFAVPIETFAHQQIFIRVHTTNAIILDADLWQVSAFTEYETRSNFYRGGYFGILLIAVLLYVILGARLRDAVMLAYAAYVASQILFHLGTNGYFPVLLAWHSAWLSDALPRIGWLAGGGGVHGADVG